MRTMRMAVDRDWIRRPVATRTKQDEITTMTEMFLHFLHCELLWEGDFLVDIVRTYFGSIFMNMNCALSTTSFMHPISYYCFYRPLDWYELTCLEDFRKFQHSST